MSERDPDSPAMEKRSLSRKGHDAILDSNDDHVLPPLSPDGPLRKRRTSFHRDDDGALPALRLTSSRETDCDKRERVSNLHTDDTRDRWLGHSSPFPSQSPSRLVSSPTSSVHLQPISDEKSTSLDAGEEETKREANAGKKRSGGKDKHDEEHETDDKTTRKERKEKKASPVSTSPKTEDDSKKEKKRPTEGTKEGTALGTPQNVLSPSKIAEGEAKHKRTRKVHTHHTAVSPYRGKEKEVVREKEHKRRRKAATSPPPPSPPSPVLPLDTVSTPPTCGRDKKKSRRESRSSSSSSSRSTKEKPLSSSRGTISPGKETTLSVASRSPVRDEKSSPTTTTTSHRVAPTPLSTPSKKKDEKKSNKKMTSTAFLSPTPNRSTSPSKSRSISESSLLPSPPLLAESKEKKKAKQKSQGEHARQDTTSVMTATTTATHHSTATTTKGKAGIKHPNSKTFVHHRLREEMQADFDKRSKASHREFLRLCRATGDEGSPLPSHPKTDTNNSYNSSATAWPSSSASFAEQDRYDLPDVRRGPQDREGEGRSGLHSHSLSPLSSPSRGSKQTEMRVDQSPLSRAKKRKTTNPVNEWSTGSTLRLDSGPLTSRNSRLASLSKEEVDAHHHPSPWCASPYPSSPHGSGAQKNEVPLTEPSLPLPHPDGGENPPHRPIPLLRHTWRGESEAVEDSMIFGVGTVGLAMREQARTLHGETSAREAGGADHANGLRGRQADEKSTGFTAMGNAPKPSAPPTRLPVDASGGKAVEGGNGAATTTTPPPSTTMNVFERLQCTRKAKDGRPAVFCAVAQEAFQKHQQDCWEKQQASGATVHVARSRLAKSGGAGPYHMLAPTILPTATASEGGSVVPAAAAPPPPPAWSASTERPFTVSEFMAVQRLVRFGVPLDEATEAVRRTENPLTLCATISSLHSPTHSHTRSRRHKSSVASSMVLQQGGGGGGGGSPRPQAASPSSKDHPLALGEDNRGAWRPGAGSGTAVPPHRSAPPPPLLHAAGVGGPPPPPLSHLPSPHASLPSSTNISPAATPMAPRPLGGLVNAFGYFSMHRAQPQYYMHLEAIAGGGGGASHPHYAPGDTMKLPTSMSALSPVKKNPPTRRGPPHRPAAERKPSGGSHSPRRLSDPPEEESHSPGSPRVRARRHKGRRYHHPKKDSGDGSVHTADPTNSGTSPLSSPLRHRRRGSGMGEPISTGCFSPSRSSGSPHTKESYSSGSTTILSSTRERMRVTTTTASLPGSARALSFPAPERGGGGHSPRCLAPLGFSDAAAPLPTAVSSDSTR